MFILVNGFTKEPSSYEFLSYISKSKNNLCIPIKHIAVDYTLPIYKLCTFVNHNTFIQFVVVKEGMVKFSFYESELNKILLKFQPTTPVGKIKLV